MSLVDIMLEQLATARRIVEDGHEVVPAWRISTPEGSYLVLTRFDTDNRNSESERSCSSRGLWPGSSPRASC